MKSSVRKALIAILMIIVCVISLVACDDDGKITSKGIAGTYYAYYNGVKDASSYVTIDENGAVTAVTESDSISGTYTITDDIVNVVMNDIEYTFKVKDGVLSVYIDGEFVGIYYCKDGVTPPSEKDNDNAGGNQTSGGNQNSDPNQPSGSDQSSGGNQNSSLSDYEKAAGTYYYEYGTDYMILNADGTMTLYSDGIPCSGTYELSSGNVITITVTNGVDTMTVKAEIGDGTILVGATYYCKSGVTPPTGGGTSSTKPDTVGPVEGEFSQSGYTYKIVNGNAVLTGGSPNIHLSIESSVVIDGKTYTVTAIGDGAFEGNKYIRNLSIPETVTTIGDKAFYGCKNLQEIIIRGSSLKSIGDYAFAKCHSTYVSITFLGTQEEWDAIKKGKEWCDEHLSIQTELNHISPEPPEPSLPFQTSDLIYDIVDGNAVVKGFSKYENDHELYIPSSVEIDGKTYTVTAIGEKAFKGCAGLAAVELPITLTSIGDYAFEGCNGNVISFNLNELENLESIGDYAFADCRDIAISHMPENLKSIGDYAFSGCDMQEVELNRNLTSIGEHAFTDMHDYYFTLYFDGTQEEWNDIQKSENWFFGENIVCIFIKCNDGDIKIRGEIFEEIAGKYYAEDEENGYIELFSDGTLKISSAAVDVDGTYDIIDGMFIRFTIEINDGEMVIDGEGDIDGRMIIIECGSSIVPCFRHLP